MTSFAEKYAPILENIQRGSKAMDGIIEMLRLRINAETQFTEALQNIMKVSTKLISNCFDSKISLQMHGFDALFCDMKNEYNQRIEFLNSLKKDVLNPCLTTKQSYEQKHKLLVNESKRKTKLLAKHQNEYMKTLKKYDKIMSKRNNKKKVQKQQPIIQRRYSQQQIVWKQQKFSFNNQISLSLVNIQMIEFQRMSQLKDALTKWAAFSTNFCANRNYDIRHLTNSMSLIHIEKDLHINISKPKYKKKSSLNIY